MMIANILMTIGLTVGMWVVMILMYWVLTKVIKNDGVAGMLSLTILFLYISWILVNFVI